jgi:hypothetical protein
VAHEYNYACGCNGGEREYIGAESPGQRAALAWIPRVSGGLSLLGSLYIVVDVLLRYMTRHPLNSTRAVTSVSPRPVYDSLVGTMAAFDAVTSICWILSTAPTWKYDRYGGPSGVYGAVGNWETCQAQGFFFQLSGITSLFYNVALAVHYMLVIVYSIREETIKKWRLLLLVPPVVIGVLVSIRGLPYYTTVLIICSIPPPPTMNSWDVLIKLTLFPIAFCLLSATILTAVIYISVRKTMRASQRHDFSYSSRVRASKYFPNRSSTRSPVPKTLGTEFADLEPSLGAQSSRASRQPARFCGSEGTTMSSTSQDRALSNLFWQCFFYLAAFLISYPVWFTSLLKSESTSYWFWIAVVVLTPLQGFLNFLVYARSRRLGPWRTQRRRRPPLRRDNPEETAISATNRSRDHGTSLEEVSSKQILSGAFQDAEPSSTRADDTSYSLDASRLRDGDLQQGSSVNDSMFSLSRDFNGSEQVEL